ncbi:MAG TPA: META domain-containing protein [Candidatus Limnocylindrales bacterium]|nr:META domain-containing protein [Candidatus Limnocylindrales bacterium]
MKRATFLLVLLSLVLAGCSQAGAEMSPTPTAPQSLAGSSWTAISVSGAAPLQGREPTLVFADDQRINGNTGCNGFFGGYAYGDGEIEFSQVGMTMMACEDPVNTVEAAFTKALNAATTAAIDDGGQLLIAGPGGEILFAPAPTPG